MSYRNTELPDKTPVQLTLTLGQVKILEQLVNTELAEVEMHDGSPFEEKPLQRLLDLFWPHLYIQLTETEEQAKADDLRRQWANAELKALNAAEAL
jgi:hypothetical protein